MIRHGKYRLLSAESTCCVACRQVPPTQCIAAARRNFGGIIKSFCSVWQPVWKVGFFNYSVILNWIVLVITTRTSSLCSAMNPSEQLLQAAKGGSTREVRKLLSRGALFVKDKVTLLYCGTRADYCIFFALFFYSSVTQRYTKLHGQATTTSPSCY